MRKIESAVAADVGPHRREQARRARLLVRPHRHVLDRHEHLAGLDQGLERVGELRDHLELERGLAVVGAEARGGVGDAGAGGAPDHGAAEALEPLLDRREVLDRVRLPVPDHHVGRAGHDRLHEPGHVAPVVLVVGVGVHDHVGAELEAGVEPGLERGGQAAIVGEPDDVVHAVLARHLHRAVGRAVVDHEPLHGVHPRATSRGRSASVPGRVSPR